MTESFFGFEARVFPLAVLEGSPWAGGLFGNVLLQAHVLCVTDEWTTCRQRVPTRRAAHEKRRRVTRARRRRVWNALGVSLRCWTTTTDHHYANALEDLLRSLPCGFGWRDGVSSRRLLSVQEDVHEFMLKLFDSDPSVCNAIRAMCVLRTCIVHHRATHRLYALSTLALATPRRRVWSSLFTIRQSVRSVALRLEGLRVVFIASHIGLNNKA